MQEFEKRYKALNANQKQAVDTLDGPVMVVAGPGTGKTELLSVRVANILQKTDTLPQNILCLTFTDSGATAMRERLAGLLGPDAYKVAIHTFHSFGSDIINRYGEYFYQGAHFRPADELSSYEILSALLEKLPHGNPLAATMNGAFSYLRDVQTTISELKRSGLTPDELDVILQHNDHFAHWVQPKLEAAFGPTLSKQSIPRVKVLLDELAAYDMSDADLTGYVPLAQLIRESLEDAYQQAVTDDSQKPLTAWKRKYLEKNGRGEQTLKDEKRTMKLRAVSGVYYDYLVAMQEHELYDYDDMILRVVHALETFDELRYTLQETYQYILVDEFQDTNDAQMRLAWNLTNNPASEGRPNLMVVGDDDQAIYRFQGANMSNILDFTTRYQDVTVVTLKDNYRSAATILELARGVITQGEERLENVLEGVDKHLTPNHTPAKPRLSARRYETTREAHHALAMELQKAVQAEPDTCHAVIARNHRQLAALATHLQALGVPFTYERQQDVLSSEPIEQLEAMARLAHYLSEQEYALADTYLSQVLSHPAWQLSARALWELSIAAQREHRSWFEHMATGSDKRFAGIADWLMEMARQARLQPLELILDEVLGHDGPLVDDNELDEQDEPFTETLPVAGFIAPYREYFFGAKQLEAMPGRYMEYLRALQTIRGALRDYRPEGPLRLRDFVEFLDLHEALELPILAYTEPGTTAVPLTLLTAHKAKGLEFDAVYVIDAQESIWGSSARSRGRLIQFTSNLPLSPAGDSADERLRLLYVALTRAKDSLTILCAHHDDNGKDLLPVGALKEELLPIRDEAALDGGSAVAALEHDWRAPLYDMPTADQATLLKPLLEQYKLSATHLANYLNVAEGGPELFLLQNLLRFPQAMSPSAAYGSAMHAALQRAHQHLIASGKPRPIEDIVHDFERTLGDYPLADIERERYTERGIQALSAFLTQRLDSFSTRQTVERDFRQEHVQVGDAVLTGTIDLLDIDSDEKTIFITDYKTGKPSHRWQGSSEYEKLKLHRYEQQLMFYKLLLNHSRDFSAYTVTGARLEFVEPDEHGDIVLLDYTYDDEKMAAFERLVGAVWQKIMTLDFAVPTGYEPSLKGIIAFEQDLLTRAS